MPVDMNKFTTDFQKKFFRGLTKNEIGGPANDAKAYKLSPPASNTSGYAYGWVQFDLPQNYEGEQKSGVISEACQIVRDAVDNIESSELMKKAAEIGWGDRTDQYVRGEVKDRLFKTVGYENSVIGTFIDLVNDQLIDPELPFRDRIDDASVTQIKKLESHVKNVIGQVTDPTSRTFLQQSELAQSIIADIRNQFGEYTNDRIVEYFNGQRVNPTSKGRGVPVQIAGKQLGLEDLMRFQLATKYCQTPNGVADIIRRWSNYVEEIGIDNIPLTQEEAQFLVEELMGILGKDYYRIIYESQDNWGIRNLIMKAYSEWYSGFYIDMDIYNRGATFKELEEYFKTAEITLSPIVFDLDGDGIETIALTGGVYFDHDGNGFSEQTGWVNRDDGLLVMDRDGNGFIDSGRELFGNATLLSNGTKAANGFQALVELDDNKDGKIDSNDTVFNQLRVWRDDGDGYSSEDELYTFDQLGIESINTGYTNTNVTDANGNTIKEYGTFTNTDGTTGSAADVWFTADKMYTVAKKWLDVPDDIAALPDLEGFGNVYDLHQAMVRDTSGRLKGLIEQFIAETGPATRRALVTTILYAWAGVENVDPLSRAARMIYGNAIGDARKLATLEAFVGEPYLGTWCGGSRDPNPHGPQTHFFVDKSFLSPVSSVLQP